MRARLSPGTTSSHSGRREQLHAPQTEQFLPQNVSDTANVVAGDVPAYLQAPVAIPILLVWFLLPVVLGYLRFRTADLG